MPEVAGLYRVHSDANKGATPLGAADRWFYVGGSDREFADPRLNDALEDFSVAVFFLPLNSGFDGLENFGDRLENAGLGDPAEEVVRGRQPSGRCHVEIDSPRQPVGMGERARPPVPGFMHGVDRQADDMPAIRRIVQDGSTKDYRWSAVIGSIVRSTPFQMRRAQS